jgi:hypothetical protein
LARLKEPQLELWQVTLQSTPAFVESLETAALSVAVAPVCKVEGGLPDAVKAIDIPGGGPAVMVMGGIVRTLVLSAVDVAVMFTFPPVGTEVGAV